MQLVYSTAPADGAYPLLIKTLKKGMNPPIPNGREKGVQLSLLFFHKDVFGIK